ncbi:MAG TPA: CDP-alcohol phosphatidyltransferase family protein [Marmoricola sp.]|nr:CDP-alcohol phosphatidyltransferase family protein [Marmoricola sp.]
MTGSAVLPEEPDPVQEQPAPEQETARPTRWRPRWPPFRRATRVLRVTADVLAVLLIWFALLAPERAYRLSPEAFLRIPLEGLVLVALALVLPARWRRVLAAVVGVLLGLLTLLKLLDMGFYQAFDRPFSLATDRGYLGPAVSLLDVTVGRAVAILAVVLVVVLLVVLLVGLPLSIARLTGLLARHKETSLRVVAALTMLWVVCATFQLRLGEAGPVASTSAAGLAVEHVRATADDVRDEQEFADAAATDRFRGAEESDLLAGLRGKDVLLVFIESYGRVALEGRESARIRDLLDSGTVRLQRQGYSSRSAWVTSSTFGGLSWLAHAALQSGLWIDNQQRYDSLLASNRLTLTRAFSEGGWRTIALLPAAGEQWPEGKKFYGYDKVYNRWRLGYEGPRFGFSKMPDQFALEAFQRLELARADRGPVMAEIDLASSHQPWNKVPRFVPWAQLGDGSLYEQMWEDVSVPLGELLSDPERVKAAYRSSIVYTLRSLVSFVETYGDEDLVMVVLGDHQPETRVTGHGASRDVPISVIAHDEAVLDRISPWSWQDGLRPRPGTPVWRMDAFRDKFFAAFGRAEQAASPSPRSP